MKRKILFLSLLIILNLLPYVFGGEPDQQNNVRGTGFRQPNENEKKYLGDRVQKVTKILPNNLALSRFKLSPSIKYGLPASVTNWMYLPPVGDQKTQNSCSAWASCYYVKTYQEAKEHNWISPNPAVNPERVMSPAFGYNLANDGVDAGSSPEVIMQIMCDHGCASLTDMPWFSSDNISWPNETAWKNGISYRGNTTSKIDLSSDAGINALKQVIANGDIAVIGVIAETNFQDYIDGSGSGIDNQVLYTRTNPPPPLPGHAITIIGYDDTKAYNDGAPKTGAFYAVNSWGSDWGIKDLNMGTSGFMYLSYSYVRDLTYQEAYVITDLTDYVPSVFGKFTINHSNRGALNVFFMGADDIANPDWSCNCLPNLGGNHPINQKIVVDLSLFNINYKNRFWLKVGDSSPPGSTGEITFMSVDKSGSGESTALDVPKNTVSGSFVYLGMIYDLLAPSLNQILTYPNPFNKRKGAMVRFVRIPLSANNVTISIYNVAGELIRTLKEGSGVDTLPDSKIATWDGKNDSGNDCASGVYIWLAKCEGNKNSGKIALVR
ncbi:MAG: hypothetical protein NT145_07405 [Elusimicrobia bacterium]|nr:hypothetical protein [Elusimicrobiota bacterium]